MPRETPEPFNMKDLFIDVKLEACVDGSTFDFLGRKLFSAEFFRENIGFGITNIDIEVNTSLQPLVVVTFKDLYGNTIFGTQNREATDDGQSIDYSVIFNWPPPKFLFSFKGYLGGPTTWVLNLKRTSTSFNSSDGSYDLKCEFVPNQWGFFADLPFLYLLAAKRLRKDKLGPNASAEQLKSVTSVFDLIKIGKQVEVKTQDTTKEFDELVKQLGSLKSNIARATAVSSILSFGEEIDGVVNNRPIKDFIKMKIPTLDDLPSEINSKEKIEQRLGKPSELVKLNAYLLLLVKFNDKGSNLNGFERYMKPPSAPSYSNFNENDAQVTSAKNQTYELISKNLNNIENEIKRLVFSTSEKKLEKITIGEIFSQTAKDAAFIIGSIIDAGLTGYRGNTERQGLRDANSNDLIGNSFPLIINKKGEEVPATETNLSDAGIDNAAAISADNFEMKFVRDFTNAISEGIARDLISDSDTPGQDDSLLKQRINNIEMTSGNPYKSYYTNIATNILVRGGIVGFMTRSNDPNRPGDYGNSTFYDNDGIQQIEEIAVRDASNITESILKGLSDIDAIRLRRFCSFFERFYSADGQNVFKYENGEREVLGSFSSFEVGANNLGVSYIELIKNYDVLMSKGGNGAKDQFLTFETLWTELKKPSLLQGVDVNEGGKINQGIVEFSNPPSTNSLFDDNGFIKDIFKQPIRDAQNPLSFVDDNTMTATRIINNGLVYCYPNASLTSNVYWAVFFRGEDNKKAQEVNSSPTDTEYKNSDKDTADAGQNEVLGYVPINSKYGNEDELLPRVATLVKYRDDSTSTGEVSVVYDFDKLKDPTPSFYGASEGPGLEQFLWNSVIVADSFEESTINLDTRNEDGIDIAGDIGYTVCHHQQSGSEGANVFGIFQATELGVISDDKNEGRNQRIFIRKVCQTIRENLDKIEDERNQVIGSVLGKAAENEASLYKQMHTLFHQWQALSYSDKRGTGGGLCGNVDENNNNGEFNVAAELERKFGSNHRNMVKNSVIMDDGSSRSLVNEEQTNEIEDGTFIYDFPLQRINGVNERENPIKVRDSIINLEPLYRINGSTTVLNVIQQICTKNNFLFIPIPGNPGYLDVKNIYSPSGLYANIEIKNFFHVLFTPTPESRTKTSNKGDSLSLNEKHKEYDTNSFSIKYGHPDNQVVNNIQVGTDDNKVTAESIINLQRLVDNENQNKKVTTDCSMLPVLAGRSYKASVDMIGNAQVYPMQFFFLENSPLFGGLYQVMKVKHSITPNDMKTSVEGIRMRFSPGGGYGSIPPITLQTFKDLGDLKAVTALGKGFDKAERASMKNIKSVPEGTGAAGSTSSVIDEGDNIPVGGYTKDKIEVVIKSKGYKWFDVEGDFALNIVGVRNTAVGSEVTNKFDDFMTVSYKDGGVWKFWSWPCTTQPGEDYVLNPGRKDGVAIVKPGQYKDSHKMRLHAGKYEALGQNGPITVYRDNNKNLNYDLNPSNLETSSGMGINIHKAGSNSSNVNSWSAGCQVFKKNADFETFMKIARNSKALHGNKFTYTLIESGEVS